MLPQQIRRDCLQVADLQFDIEECAALIARQDFSQQRKCEAFGRRPGNFISVNFRVMADHGLPVRSKSHVKLETIAAGSQRKIERGKRVFRNGLLATRSTMTKQQRTIFHKRQWPEISEQRPLVCF